MLTEFVRSFIFYFVPVLFNRGLVLLLLPIYTRMLSPENYGVFELVVVLGALINCTIPLEISHGLGRYFFDTKSRRKKNIYISTTFYFIFMVYALFLAMMFVFDTSLANSLLGPKQSVMYFRLGVIYISLNGIFQIIQEQFRWEIRPSCYSFGSFLVAIITLLSVTICYSVRTGLNGIFYSLILANTVGSIYGFCMMRQHFVFRFKLTYLKNMLAFSLPLVPSSVSVIANQYIDRAMIQHLLSLREVGIFGLGFRCASIATVIMFAFQASLTPLIYKYYTQQNVSSKLNKLFSGFIVFCGMFSVFVFMFAQNAVNFLTTTEFISASSVIPLLVLSIFISNLSLFTPGILIEKKTHLIFFINAMGLLINLVLNRMLLPQFGIVGGAIATLISSVLVFISYLICSQRYYFISFKWGKILSFCCACFLVVFLIPKIMVPEGLFVFLKFFSLFGILMFAFLIKLIDISDIRQFVSPLLIKKILSKEF